MPSGFFEHIQVLNINTIIEKRSNYKRNCDLIFSISYQQVSRYCLSHLNPLGKSEYIFLNVMKCVAVSFCH